jgi:energy-dependent translational throttle protein EttA
MPAWTCAATWSWRSETRDLLKRFEEVNLAFGDISSDEEMNDLIEEQAKLQDRIDASGAWELDRKIEIAMDALRLPPGDTNVYTLSGGELRRVALCRVLLEQPDMLLLDEPTNHLDAESVAWLEHHLAAFPGTIVAITHDRYFLDNVAEWILELDRGQGIPWKGNYSSWLEQKQERLRQEEKSASARQKTLERELEWIRMSPRAATRRARRASTPTRSSSTETSASRRAQRRSSSRRARVSATSSSTRSTSPRASTTSSSSTT